MRKNVFALTGGMGCGKSTVGEFLKKYPDVYVFDCDKTGKDILFDDINLKKIEEILGKEISIDGKIDSKKVAQIIFSDDQKKELLEKFIHPKVWMKMDEEIQKEGDEKIFIVESAILYEVGKDSDIDKVIVVTCDKSEQIKRIKIRNGWDDEQIEKYLKHQLPNETKEALGLVVINNNGLVEELNQKTKILYSYIKSGKNERLIL